MRKFRSLGRWLVGSLALAAIALAFASSEKAAEIQKTINDYRTSLVAEGQKGGKTVDYQAIQQKVQAKAQELLKGVDAKSLDATESGDWAPVYMTAGKYPEALTLAMKYADVATDPQKKFSAQTLAVSAAYASKSFDTLGTLLSNISPYDKASSLTFASLAISYGGAVADEIGLDKASSIFDRAIGLVNEGDLTDQEKTRFNGVKQSAALAKIDILKDSGKTKEALAEIDKDLAGTSDENFKRRLNGTKTQLTLVGSIAPSLKVERSQGGTFTGLDQYKGKVVLIDFFAHWCPPCKASYPDMRKLYDDLHGKGLEIVGVTTYYGFYNAEKGLSKDVEFGKMADFIKEYNIAWPVAYGEHDNFDAYGISGIPTVIIVDRDGKVHSLDVGYSPESFKKFREEVEKLVG